MRPLPRIFDRLVIVLAGQAHLFLGLTILQAWSVYDWPWANVVLWCVSLAVPVGCVVVARRRFGELSTVAFTTAAGLLLTIDIVQAVVVPQAAVGGPAVWAWAAGGVTILTLAAYRPARPVVTLAGLHTLAALLTLAAAHGEPTVTRLTVLTVINETMLPALAAATYLNSYVAAVRHREAVVTRRLAAEAQAASLATVTAESADRLAGIRADVLPLLQQVASSALPVDSPEVSREARRLADRLRHELVDSRVGRWLLDEPTALSAPDTLDRWPGIIWLDPDHLLGRLSPQQRAAASALLAALRSHGGWQRVSVGLTHDPQATGTATLAIVALGDHAHTAAENPDIRSAAHTLNAEVTTELSTALVIEVDVPLMTADALSGAALREL